MEQTWAVFETRKDLQRIQAAMPKAIPSVAHAFVIWYWWSRQNAATFLAVPNDIAEIQAVVERFFRYADVRMEGDL